MTSENLAALIELLKDSLGNPPSEITPTQEEQAEDDATEDTDLVSCKRERVDLEPSITDHPEIEPTVAQEDVIPYFFYSSFPETTTRIEPASSSCLRFDVGGSSSGVIVLEQDSILKDAQISFLQDQVSNKDQTIKQLQSDVNRLMCMVFDLKEKLEKLDKKFGREFADVDDDPMNIEQRDQTAEERAAAYAEREAVLEQAGSSHPDDDKKMWLVIRESGHKEYYYKESQFESWTKIVLKNLLRAP
ncbi:hypothetical protein Hanom_Chr16g01441761 [Helianthus anomalus]